MPKKHLHRLECFVRDILFTKEGFNLKPTVFTDSTKKLEADKQIPSVSTKQHLPYFDHNPFVQKFIPWKKMDKLKSTYIGHEYQPIILPPDEEVQRAIAEHRPIPKPIPEQPATGFWQYLYRGKIHPSFLLHRTVTLRSSSESPNGQNFPKRGPLAKEYRRIFVPADGYEFLELDLSQAELRLVAWMANDPYMINLYRQGVDIHAATAAMVMGLSIEEFMALPKEVKKEKRGQAKTRRL